MTFNKSMIDASLLERNSGAINDICLRHGDASVAVTAGGGNGAGDRRCTSYMFELVCGEFGHVGDNLIN